MTFKNTIRLAATLVVLAVISSTDFTVANPGGGEADMSGKFNAPGVFLSQPINQLKFPDSSLIVKQALGKSNGTELALSMHKNRLSITKCVQFAYAPPQGVPVLRSPPIFSRL
ncbi:hypothetical protein BDF19DRAFT_126051 [Syncephalis fuscata]|nr:hypothetical protein BDF19DRAFT_126051 [Syncephalis fuscata]